MSDRLQHSDYPRDGYKLDVGRLWEINTGYGLRDLSVRAGADSIRILDSYGDWEISEQSAVHLSIEQARALGEILLAAADVTESRSNMWRTHANQADPRPALKRASDERRRKFDAEVAEENTLRALREKLAGTEVAE